jgi:carbamoyl-phosphate synthase large subunit
MSKHRRFTVLITGAGTATCQSVIKGLRSQHEFDPHIITVDMSSDNAGRYLSDHFEIIPAANDNDFIDRVLQIVQQHQVDLLIPIVDYEFPRFAETIDRFNAIGCRVVLSSSSVIETCNDKWKTFQFLNQLGIDTPDSWLPGDLEVDTAKFPLFVKPQLMGRGSLDCHVVHSPAELDRVLQSVKSPIVQQLVTGREYTVDMLCDFKGKAINGVVRERTETKSGVSYKGVTVLNQAVLEQAAKIVEALPIVGPSNLQCFVNDQAVTFIEINPRFSGALALSIAAGFNSPGLLLALHAGRAVPTQLGQYEEGVRMFRFWQEVFVNSMGAEIPSSAMPTVP